MLQRALCALMLVALCSQPAAANCPEQLASPELARRVIASLWPEFSSRQNFPWGPVNPYARLEGETFHLSLAFELLSAPAKRQALALLTLEQDWPERVEHLLGSLEQPELAGQVEIGHGYRVVASDGRLVSAVYDACTRETLLTEKARFSFYSNRPPAGSMPASGPHNGDKPAWRQLRYPLAVQREASLRRAFWQQVGVSRAEQGWFEINLPSAQALPELRQRFLERPPNTIAMWSWISRALKFGP